MILLYTTLCSSFDIIVFILVRVDDDDEDDDEPARKILLSISPLNPEWMEHGWLSGCINFIRHKRIRCVVRAISSYKKMAQRLDASTDVLAHIESTGILYRVVSVTESNE